VDQAESVPEGRLLQGTVRVFDPAMCCDTGVCGPAVDTSLLDAARDLRWLSAQGVDVVRHNLGTDAGAFVAFAPARMLLQEHGVDALPATWVNGTMLVSGRHATRGELLQALGASNETASS
jgi:hypothetical protein